MYDSSRDPLVKAQKDRRAAILRRLASGHRLTNCEWHEKLIGDDVLRCPEPVAPREWAEGRQELVAQRVGRLHLTEREAHVLKARRANPPVIVREIAAELGVSTTRVQQIERVAEEKVAGTRY